MAAVKIMDARMDSGMELPASELPESDRLDGSSASTSTADFDPFQPLNVADILWIMDRLLACEAAWHQGSGLSQTLYTCLYFHSIKSLSHKHPRFQTPSESTKETGSVAGSEEQGSSTTKQQRPLELVYKVLRAFLLATVKTIDIAWSELTSKQHLQDGEDFSADKNGLSLLETTDSGYAIAELEDALEWLQSQANALSQQQIESLRVRLNFRKQMLYAVRLLQSASEAAPIDVVMHTKFARRNWALLRPSFLSKTRDGTQPQAEVSTGHTNGDFKATLALQLPNRNAAPSTASLSAFDPAYNRRLAWCQALRPISLPSPDETWSVMDGILEELQDVVRVLQHPGFLNWKTFFTHRAIKYQSSQPLSATPRSKPQTGIASIILVPSNELAIQYLRWARALFPAPSLPSLDPVIQCLVRGGVPGSESLTPLQELRRLKETPPHILIGTPGRIKDILDTPAGSSQLGLDTLRTLVLDEADAVLQLPGRFPSHKQRWKHEVHKAPGLLILNEVMKRRATFSGGEKHLTAGLENRPGKRRDEKRPPEHVRRNTYKAAERAAAASIDPNTGLALPKARGPGVHPLQLVATSATANSVMRHFFGARTGWLRTGAKESGLTFAPQVGRWIDLTGLSGKSMVDQGIRGLFGANERSRTDSLIQTSLDQTPSTMPPTIEHTCVVVDEAPLSRQLTTVPLRNFEPKLARKKGDASSPQNTESPDTTIVGDDFLIIKPESEPQEHEMDQILIEALAFCFASEGVNRGLALIPARWSLLKARAALEALGVSVRLATDGTSAPPLANANAGEPESSEAGPELFLLQTTSSRGLDIPALSHVFLIGYASVLDAVQYVHSAGRVARIGGDPDAVTKGKVVTLLRGLPHDTPLPDSLQSNAKEHGSRQRKKAISTSEAKMANVYRRLGVVPKKFDLGLLTSGAAATAVSKSEEGDTADSTTQSRADTEQVADQEKSASAST
ncbi:hypothetical protein NDA16_000393 [Ustilago loliicola]|nr:hypothetical protein NDA16_000393 [Ustilago loliicola]